MSKYFRTLRRLQTDASSVVLGPESGMGAVEYVPFEHHTFPGINLQSAKAQRSFARLLEGLRLAAQPSPSHSVVVAAVSNALAASHVVTQLEAQARQKPLEVVTGALSIVGGRQALTLRDASFSASPADAAAVTPSVESPVSLDLDTASLSQDLQGRIARVNPKFDLSILLAPPLATSVEAALLARATSGLVIVLEPLVTTRADLHLALSRAEYSGSSVIGFVMLGTRRWLPRWIQRLLDVSGR